MGLQGDNMRQIIKPTYAVYFGGGMRSRALLAWAKDIFSISNEDAIVISVATNRTSAKTVQYMQAISEAAGLQFRLLTGCFGDEMNKSNAIFAYCREKQLL